MSKEHLYKTTIRWTGNKGSGTSDYRDYDRDHVISIENKIDIQASSDAAFRGDGTKHNPEDMLLAALSSCHMLWYLHLCADAGVVVEEYLDNATGTMIENNNGGKFSEVTLFPEVVVSDSAMIEKAYNLHKKANEKCFIANSVNFVVRHQAKIISVH